MRPIRPDRLAGSVLTWPCRTQMAAAKLSGARRRDGLLFNGHHAGQHAPVHTFNMLDKTRSVRKKGFKGNGFGKKDLGAVDRAVPPFERRHAHHSTFGRLKGAGLPGSDQSRHDRCDHRHGSAGRAQPRSWQIRRKTIGASVLNRDYQRGLITGGERKERVLEQWQKRGQRCRRGDL